jgi:hypothetical protein
MLGSHDERRAERQDHASMRMTDLRPGWAVLGNDGKRVGTVRRVSQNYITTSRPGFAPDVFVPASAVANVADETVHLNIRHSDVDAMGWEQGPRSDDRPDVGPVDDLHRHI